MSVDNVLVVTSSITSSSSPVDLFCTNHSKTSSSRCSSPAAQTRFDNKVFVFFVWIFKCVSCGQVVWELWRSTGFGMLYLHRWSESDGDSRPMPADCPGCIHRPMPRRVFWQNRCPVDRPHRRYSPILARPWRIFGIAVYLMNDVQRLDIIYCKSTSFKGWH